MNPVKIINDVARKEYIGLEFFGSYGIGYWKQITKAYKSPKRLVKYNPQFTKAIKNIQEI